MFPIRDHNPSRSTPYVVYALIALNAAIFFSYWTLPERQIMQTVFLPYALFPVRLSYGEGYATLITSTFLHGGLMHLAGNMLFLWIFGDNLEDQMGHVGFLLFYLACGTGAGLIHVAAAPGSQVPTVGASGAIAGVMGGYLLLYPRARVDILLILIIFFRIFTVPAWLMLGLWLAMQFIGGLEADPTQGGVAYWAHTGGFAVGLILTLPLWLRRGGPGFWAAQRGQPANPAARYRYGTSHIPKVPRRR
ncbi:rhomboid family intramembrane serine protease [Pseudodonghicola flavimaris]|uniref:Rhomboid family intramembrane serine protease n=1 Tax=Pseudodonghicola flavimaris TaxID=3050036 RepID=A0ABT7F5V6_9RHOB|nr:rhomboid family intramembrane serine protease [Pseudodonghicola flavimaris]MDK3019991.1 rhomboid family intramembrane serine protease [Pseudodonghicola flavimaris]